VQRPGQPSPGWYLTSPNGPTYGSYAIIFDEYGAPVWYKRLPQAAGDFKRLSDGTVALVPASTPFGITPSVGYWNFRTNGTPVRRLRASDPDALPLDHHDLLQLDGGGRVILSYPTTGCAPAPGDPPTPGPCQADLSMLTPIDNGPPGPAYTTTQPYADGAIEEVGSNNARLWLWHASEHIPPSESTLPVRFTVVPSLSTFVDAYHINSIDRQPDGDYVASARHLDAVFRIDRATGEIDWALGGSPSRPGRFCGAGSVVASKCLDIVGDPRNGPKRPHDARLRGDVLTMMDNRTDTGQPSRAVAYRINPAAGTATMLWQIRQSAGTTGPTLGSTRVAPDGSILVGWPEPIQAMYQEFDANRNLLLSIGNPGPLLFSYRVVKEPKSAFDVNTLRSQAGGATLVPPPP
jgi:hypothetical protein